MPAVKFRCPECDALIRRPEVPAGKKVRCPECDALVRPPADDEDAPTKRPRRRDDDDDDDDRPRKSRSGGKKAKKTSPLVYVIPVAFVLLLGVAGVLGYLVYTRNSAEKKDEPVAVRTAPPNLPPKNAAPAPNAPVPTPGPNAGAANASTPPTGTDVGKLALEIEAEDLDGKTFKLSDYRGKVVLLDFWGDW